MSAGPIGRSGTTSEPKLRVVILTCRSTGCAARLVHYLARVPDAPFEVVGMLLDTKQSTERGHWRRRMRAWRRCGGLPYVLWRLWLHGRDRLFGRDAAAEYPHSVEELGERLDFPVLRVPDINLPVARQALADMQPDVGLSIENRILREDIIAVPRLGIVNLHYGRIPDYRGIPPAFWELFHGSDTMAVTVHRVDRLLDHGDVLATEVVPVLAEDDSQTLFERALSVDHRALEQVLADLASGDPRPQPVDWSQDRLHTLPSWGQLRAIRRRRGRTIRHDGASFARLNEVRIPRAAAGAAVDAPP